MSCRARHYPYRILSTDIYYLYILMVYKYSGLADSDPILAVPTIRMMLAQYVHIEYLGLTAMILLLIMFVVFVYYSVSEGQK